MDEDRRIRFLVAPIIFVTSLALGVFLDDGLAIVDIWRPQSKATRASSVDKPKAETTPAAAPEGAKDNRRDEVNWSNILTIIGAGGILVFVAGVLIGTTTYVLMRVGFYVVRGGRHGGHEVALADQDAEELWRRLGLSGPFVAESELFLGSTFDHDCLRKEHRGIHRWLTRRWNALAVSSTSAVGLVMSLIVGHVFVGIAANPKWTVTTFFFIFVFTALSFFAWKDTMGMIGFQIRRGIPVKAVSGLTEARASESSNRSSNA